ncbi:MAG TPA: RDD family protein [Mycobacterium sp.]|nr:RDD family protein [Mycobacterium sp.]
MSELPGHSAGSGRILPAGRTVRCSSFLLDLAAMLSPALPLSIIAALVGVAAVVYVVVPVGFVAIWAWMQIWQSMTGASFGKTVLGLRLVRAADYQPPGLVATLGRSLVFVFTLGIAGLPVLLGRGSGWHDRVGRLIVLDVANGADPIGPGLRGGLRRRRQPSDVERF